LPASDCGMPFFGTRLAFALTAPRASSRASNRSVRFGRGTRGPRRLTPVRPVAGSTHSRTQSEAANTKMADVSLVRHRLWPSLRASERRGPPHRVVAHPFAARNWLARPHCRCTRQGPKQRLRRRLLRGFAQVPAESAEVEATAVAKNAAWQTVTRRRPHDPSRRPGRRVQHPNWASRRVSKHALRLLSHLVLLSLASGWELPLDAPLEGATAEAAATSGGSCSGGSCGVGRRLGGSECDESWCEAMAAGHATPALRVRTTDSPSCAQ
jgi:hypothetical protein